MLQNNILRFPPPPQMLEIKTKQNKTPNHLYWSARAAVANYQKLDGLDNKTLLSQGAGGIGK